MPTWRCPHCGTPQAETSRCWVCKRSSTSCGTCRHFRRSIAGQLGYCGLDRRRLPLRGDELRGCWEPAPAADPVTPTRVLPPATTAPAPRERRLDFVPLDLPAPPPVADSVAPATPSPIAPAAVPAAPDPLLGLWAEER